MRRSGLLLTLLALVAAMPGAAQAAPSLPLSQQGRWITDADGRVTILHGHNMVYKRPPYHPAAIGFGDDDAAFLAREGYNTIRLGLIYKAVEPQPGVYDDAYLARIAETVETLGRHGIVSQLDFHQDLYNERFQGEGWPDWAVQDDGLPAQPKLGFPNNYFGMPALSRAFDHFWANDPGPGGVGLQDRYAAAWRHVAARFKDNRFVMGYDLMNEPWPGTTWQTCANPIGCPVFDATMRRFIDKMVAAIRQVDRENVIWYEPNVIFNSGADTQVGSPPGGKLGFSFHDYCLTASGTMSNLGCDTFDDLVFLNAERQSRRSGDALLLSEFAATDNPEIVDAMVERTDRNMVSWQHWAYCGCADPTTAGPGNIQAIVIDPAKPPTGANVKAAKLGLLSRPYPQVVAGTPRSFDFDPGEKKFSLRYSTERAGGGGARFGRGSESEVFLPERQYPDGWKAKVEGGAIVPGAAAGAGGGAASARRSRGTARPAQAANADDVLTVEPCPGAEDITVSVTPTGQSSDSCAASAEAAAAGPGTDGDPGGSGDGNSDPAADDAGAAGESAGDGSNDGGSLPLTGLTLALLIALGAALLSAGILLRGRVRRAARLH